MRVGRLKSFVGRALCSSPFSEIVSACMGESTRVGRCRIDAAPAVVSAATRASLFWGMYESAELRFVSAYLRRDLDVVELGSSIGVVSAHIARRLESGRTLVCVEANRRLVPTLMRNVQANGPDVKATFLNCAIAYDTGGGGVMFGVSRDNVASRIGRGALVERVDAAGLSDILRTTQVRDYALVCDIEGAEAGILRHDLEALGGCKQIIIELHQTAVDGSVLTVEDLAKLVTAQGFQAEASYGPVFVFRR